MTPQTNPSNRPLSRRRRASIQVRCPRCDEVLLYDVERLASEGKATCPGCGLGRIAPDSADLEAAPSPQVPVERCWYCANEEFYVQKDFNRKLGFWLVTFSALAVFLVMLLIHHLVGIVLLLLIALLDAIVYHLIPTVSVCYLCQGVYRGFPLAPGHRGFYLGSEEKYKHLRQDWLDKVEVDGPRTDRTGSTHDSGGDRGGSGS